MHILYGEYSPGRIDRQLLRLKIYMIHICANYPDLLLFALRNNYAHEFVESSKVSDPPTVVMVELCSPSSLLANARPAHPKSVCRCRGLTLIQVRSPIKVLPKICPLRTSSQHQILTSYSHSPPPFKHKHIYENGPRS